jgi:alkylated DNA repair protein (DNA oxidative demethylase)
MSSRSQPTRTPRARAVPTALPPEGAAPLGQLGLALDAPAPDPRPLAERTSKPLPDVVHVERWLDPADQRALVAAFRRWALPPAGLRHPRVLGGALMSVQSVCLGWHWQPNRYARTADDTDGAPVKPLPPELVELARRAVRDSGLDPTRPYEPDAAIVNLYAPGSKLGLHQDGEEPAEAPVVTLSLGDDASFRMAAVDRRTGPFTDIVLRSGDLLVFGGVNRRIFHGVPRTRSGSGPGWLDLPGRLSITVRETGFA